MKKRSIRSLMADGNEAGLRCHPESVSAPWGLYLHGLTSDLSIAPAGLQQILDKAFRGGVVAENFTLDRAIDGGILKIAQQELRSEGKIK